MRPLVVNIRCYVCGIYRFESARRSVVYSALLDNRSLVAARVLNTIVAVFARAQLLVLYKYYIYEYNISSECRRCCVLRCDDSFLILFRTSIHSCINTILVYF